MGWVGLLVMLDTNNSGKKHTESIIKNAGDNSPVLKQTTKENSNGKYE